MEQVTWYVGIDWGSESHAVSVVDAAGHRREERCVDHTADAVRACLDWIMTLTGATPAQISVAIETPRGALVDACLARRLLVFAVNPKQLDRFRDRHTVAGAKDDRRDAWVLADSLRTDPAAFQQVHSEDPIVVQLRELSVQRKIWTRNFAAWPTSCGVRCIGSYPRCSRCAQAPMNRGSGRCCRSHRRPRRKAA